MADTQITSSNSPTCMESVNRIAKLPVVESSIQAASNVYERVKEYNGLTQWTCSTAENVVHKAVEVSKPIVQNFEGPIKKVDGVLCTGLDYVETKVPAVKLPPGEIIYQMYSTTKDFVTPKVEAAYAYVEPTVKSAYEKIEPMVEPAVKLVEPAFEKAKSIVEPAVESIMQYGSKKMEEIKQCTRGHPEGDLECDECQAAAKKME